MYHDITIRCGLFVLRPVTLQDAEFIFHLRTDPQVGRFIVNTSDTLQQQMAWLELYSKRNGDYYFIIEHASSHESQGTVAIYDVNSSSRTAEWGRWLVKSHSLCALASAWMIYECAFALLGLSLLYCRTQEANAKVISFHDSFGAVRRAAAVHDPTYISAVIEHYIELNDWPIVRSRVGSMISRLTRTMK